MTSLSEKEISEIYKGEFNLSETYRILYSCDASVYRELPLGVAFPSNDEEVLQLIQLAIKHKISLIPRGAGTSLAGQVVGKGLVLDFSKNFNKILEINLSEKYAIVQPGVVLDELNLFLKPYGLFFAPETSTSNRCTIGGMIGNNSCGTRSLIYKTTREHILELEGFLSDGTKIKTHSLTKEEFNAKLNLLTLEGDIYRAIHNILSNRNNLNHIEEQYPDKRLHRRNMGYALDILAKTNIYDHNSNEPFNLSKLIAGSEGTLMIITRAKLKLTPLPPQCAGLICVHLDNFNDTFDANLVALQHSPTSVELIDNIIVNLARTNKEQDKNSFFVQGNPAAILIVEFAENTYEELHAKANKLISDLQKLKLGYAYTIVTGNDIAKVWNLRKAGLGILSNMEGERKPITFIEDIAIHPENLKAFSNEIQKLFHRYSIKCVYYAHIGSGEIHLKPALNLKSKNDRKLLRIIAKETAHIVKKYNGSLSGEHGDGRLRGEFIPVMLGEKIYSWLREIKHTFDPNKIFNPEKIVDTPGIDSSLRYHSYYNEWTSKNYFRYLPEKNWLHAIEKCNGSADCRRSLIVGGNMCPTYMATQNEFYTTRARANLLREILSTKQNPFQDNQLYEILNYCISCKACKTECPSNIDMAKFKAEFLQLYYEQHHISFRTKIIANITKIYKVASLVPFFSNFFLKNKYIAKVLKRTLGFSENRDLPKISKRTFYSFAKKNNKTQDSKIFLFCDEFTNFIDADIGIKTFKLFEKLGYTILVLPPM